MPNPEIDAPQQPFELICICAWCGSTELQATSWYVINTGQLVDSDPQTDDLWCPSCDDAPRAGMDHVYYTDLEEDMYRGEKWEQPD